MRPGLERSCSLTWHVTEGFRLPLNFLLLLEFWSHCHLRLSHGFGPVLMLSRGCFTGVGIIHLIQRWSSCFQSTWKLLWLFNWLCSWAYAPKSLVELLRLFIVLRFSQLPLIVGDHVHESLWHSLERCFSLLDSSASRLYHNIVHIILYRNARPLWLLCLDGTFPCAYLSCNVLRIELGALISLKLHLTWFRLVYTIDIQSLS